MHMSVHRIKLAHISPSLTRLLADCQVSLDLLTGGGGDVDCHSVRHVAIGTVVKTTYGNGTVRGYGDDGRAEVELPWATIYMTLVRGGENGAAVAASVEPLPQSERGRAEDLEDEDDDGEEEEDDGVGAQARAGSFSFAMVNNGTIMTQMVVGLLVQQVRVWYRRQERCSGVWHGTFD